MHASAPLNDAFSHFDLNSQDNAPQNVQEPISQVRLDSVTLMLTNNTDTSPLLSSPNSQCLHLHSAHTISDLYISLSLSVPSIGMALGHPLNLQSSHPISQEETPRM